MDRSTRAFVKAAAWLILIGMPAAHAQAVRPAAEAEAIARVRAFVAREREAKELPGLSIAVADGRGLVWAEGFGEADSGRKLAASPTTLYRVGSVAEPFTALALMRLVERGGLDLDAPVTRVLPDFRPAGPPGKPITLRQLLAHRSGLPSEPPRGNLVDPAPPPLAEVVRSLDGATLVYDPGTRPKESAAGYAVAGRLLEVAAGRPFAEAVRAEVLAPMGLGASTFEPDGMARGPAARGTMWTYDGRTLDAPTFPLGIAPAAGLVSNVSDLAKFASALLRAWDGREETLVRRATLRAMWTPQFAGPGGEESDGLGFRLGKLDGLLRVRRGGSVYGFSSVIVLLPDRDLAIAIAANLDAVDPMLERMADVTLSALASARSGRPAAEPPPTDPLPPGLALRLDGRYAGEGKRLELSEFGGGLFAHARGVRVGLRAEGRSLRLDGRLGYGDLLGPLGGGRVEWDGATLTRLPDVEPPAAPHRGLVGEYGPDFRTFYILEKDGNLHALVGWFHDCPLVERGPAEFAFPDGGPFAGERLVFTLGPDGQARGVRAGGIDLVRRPVGTSEATFKVAPVRPVPELEAEARRASPPRETIGDGAPPLVDIAALDPTIKLDIRYASDNNFLGQPLYRSARAFLRKPAAEALLRAHRGLKEKGFGLMIHDGYRPWYVTKTFWDATPPDLHDFVSDPAKGSRHNRGAAVDLTLYRLATGAPVEMVSGYDEFSPRAYPGYPGGTSRARWHRDLLRRAMEEQGFTVYLFEWWHFDYQGWRAYPILNKTFEELAAGR